MHREAQTNKTRQYRRGAGLCSDDWHFLALFHPRNRQTIALASVSYPSSGLIRSDRTSYGRIFGPGGISVSEALGHGLDNHVPFQTERPLRSTRVGNICASAN